MERLIKTIIFAGVVTLAVACGDYKDHQNKTDVNAIQEPAVHSVRERRDALESRGFQTFEYIDEAGKDTVLMQQYFIVFLKRGTVHSATKTEMDSLQARHLAHLKRMYEEGYADISGPFGDDGDIRGITIYNTPTQAMADSLAHLDPMVQTGRLQIEVHPWWAAKGFPLR